MIRYTSTEWMEIQKNKKTKSHDNSNWIYLPFVAIYSIRTLLFCTNIMFNKRTQGSLSRANRHEIFFRIRFLLFLLSLRPSLTEPQTLSHRRSLYCTTFHPDMLSPLACRRVNNVKKKARKYEERIWGSVREGRRDNRNSKNRIRKKNSWRLALESKPWVLLLNILLV